MRKFLSVLFLFVVSTGTAAAQCTVPNTLTNGNNADATQVMANFNALLTCLNNLPTATPVIPQGRLTLVNATPVMTSSQSGKTVIYYTPYAGNQVPIYNGTIMVPTAFTELSNITTNSSTGKAGPAAVVASKNYDLFVWNDSGTIRLTRGGPWNSDIARSSGTENDLQRINGVWTNLNAITNGPAVNLGTYVGTVRSNGSAQIDFIPGGVAINGTAASIGVWNAYNRVAVRGFVGDSTAQWTYTTATVRAANGSNTMRVSLVQGLLEDYAFADYTTTTSATAGNQLNAGICLDNSTAFVGRVGYSQAINSAAFVPTAGNHAVQLLGFHYLQACEFSSAAGTSFWWGTGGGLGQNGLTYMGMF